MPIFLLTHWKTLSVAALVAVLLASTFAYRTAYLSERAKVATGQAERAVLTAQLSTLAQRTVELTRNLEVARTAAQRIEVRTVEKIVRLKAQPIPKQCDAAITWAIRNNGELTWD